MNIAKAIKLARQASNLTQRELAHKAKTSYSYLSLLERGKRSPGIDLLKKISIAFSIPMVILIFLATEDNDLPKLDKELTLQLRMASYMYLHKE